MKQQDITTNKLPTRELYFGLEHLVSDFIDGLANLGTVYLQARTDCGGLGKLCEMGSVYIDPDRDLLCAPASGLNISLEGLIAIHATASNTSGEDMYAFDFEFVDRPCGFSIYTIPLASNIECYSNLIDSFFGEPFEKKFLDIWREESAPPSHHCEKCAHAGRLRAANPQSHPVYTIAADLITRKQSVYARLLSSHADLSATITPGNILIDGGVISVVDRESTVIAINMHNLHALVVKEKRIDGADFSAMELYNSIGTQGLEFLVEDISLVHEWTAICSGDRP